MRRPRSIDVIGVTLLVLSLLAWYLYYTTGETRVLLAFFALSGIGIAIEPLARRSRRLGAEGARRRHPSREQGRTQDA